MAGETFHSTTNRRTKVRLFAVLALVASLAAVVRSPEPAAPDEIGCATPPPAQVDCGWPWGSGGGSGGGGGGGGGGGPDGCVWVAYDESDVNLHEMYEELLEVPEGMTPIIKCGTDCLDPDDWQNPQVWSSQCMPFLASSLSYTDAAVPPGEIVEQYLLEELWVRVAGLLKRPDVRYDPVDPDSPAIVTMPTFVEVTNWVYDDERDSCALFGGGQLCVFIEWDSSMFFDPGEQGVARISCEPPGQLYDPASSLTADQQAAGACAHPYRQDTSGEDDYEATVTARYEFEWRAEANGTQVWDGVFDPIELDSSFTRAVDEVQPIVTDVELGE